MAGGGLAAAAAVRTLMAGHPQLGADTGGWHLDISFEECDRLLAADAKPASTELTPRPTSPSAPAS